MDGSVPSIVKHECSHTLRARSSCLSGPMMRYRVRKGLAARHLGPRHHPPFGFLGTSGATFWPIPYIKTIFITRKAGRCAESSVSGDRG